MRFSGFEFFRFHRDQVDFNIYGLKDTSGLDSSARRQHLQGCLDYFFGGPGAASKYAFFSSVNFGGREGLVFVSIASSYRLAGYLCFDDDDHIIMITIDGGRSHPDAADPVDRKELLLRMLGVDNAQVYSHSETPLYFQLPADFEITEESDSGITAGLFTDTYYYALFTNVDDRSYDADMLDLISYDDLLTGMWNQFQPTLIKYNYTIKQGFFVDQHVFSSSVDDLEGLSEEIGQWNAAQRPEGGYANSYLMFLGSTPDGGNTAIAFLSGGYKNTIVLLDGWTPDESAEAPDLEAMLKEMIRNQ